MARDEKHQLELNRLRRLIKEESRSFLDELELCESRVPDPWYSSQVFLAGVMCGAYCQERGFVASDMYKQVEEIGGLDAMRRLCQHVTELGKRIQALEVAGQKLGPSPSNPSLGALPYRPFMMCVSCKWMNPAGSVRCGSCGAEF